MDIRTLVTITFIAVFAIGYIAAVGYLVFWVLIAKKVEEEFSTMLHVTYKDGHDGYVPGFSIPPGKFNNWIFKMYKKKFGA